MPRAGKNFFQKFCPLLLVLALSDAYIFYRLIYQVYCSMYGLLFSSG